MQLLFAVSPEGFQQAVAAIFTDGDHGLLGEGHDGVGDLEVVEIVPGADRSAASKVNPPEKTARRLKVRRSVSPSGAVRSAHCCSD